MTLQRYYKKMTYASAHAIFSKFYSFCGNFYHSLPLRFSSFLLYNSTLCIVQNAVLLDQQLAVNNTLNSLNLCLGVTKSSSATISSEDDLGNTSHSITYIIAITGLRIFCIRNIELDNYIARLYIKRFSLLHILVSRTFCRKSTIYFNVTVRSATTGIGISNNYLTCHSSLERNLVALEIRTTVCILSNTHQSSSIECLCRVDKNICEVELLLIARQSCCFLFCCCRSSISPIPSGTFANRSKCGSSSAAIIYRVSLSILTILGYYLNENLRLKLFVNRNRNICIIIISDSGYIRDCVIQTDFDIVSIFVCCKVSRGNTIDLEVAQSSVMTQLALNREINLVGLGCNSIFCGNNDGCGTGYALCICLNGSCAGVIEFISNFRNLGSTHCELAVVLQNTLVLNELGKIQSVLTNADSFQSSIV